MKITVNSKALLSAVNVVSKAIPVKTSLPILENILLKGYGNTLTIYAFDGNVGIRYTIPATTTEGKLLVPGRQFSDIIKALPNCETTIVGNELSCDIDWGVGTSTMPVVDYSTYPELPTFQGEVNVIVKGKVLQESLAVVTPFVGKDDMRPIMSGVHFNSQQTSIDLVSSDSKALAICPVAADVRDAIKVTVPISAINVVKAMNVEDKDVFIHADDKNVFFATEDCCISGRLIEGKYPKYDAVIPKANVNVARFDAFTFSKAVSRVAVCSNKVTSAVKFTFKDSQTPLVEAQDLGFNVSAKEHIGNSSYSGEDIVIGFNSNALLRIINAIQGDSIDVKLLNAKAATLLTSAEESELQCQYILMPIATA